MAIPLCKIQAFLQHRLATLKGFSQSILNFTGGRGPAEVRTAGDDKTASRQVWVDQHLCQGFQKVLHSPEPIRLGNITNQTPIVITDCNVGCLHSPSTQSMLFWFGLGPSSAYPEQWCQPGIETPMYRIGNQKPAPQTQHQPWCQCAQKRSGGG